MQFSVGVEYALHCLLYLVALPPERSVGVRDLSAYQGVSETYLSKIFTRLKKAGLVHAVPGVRGGYRLARKAEQISFWDVVEAVEGPSPMFQCSEIRQREVLLDKEHLPEAYTSCPCTIKLVMDEAEDQMRQYLKARTLAWLSAHVVKKVPAEHLQATADWFHQRDSR